MRTTQMHFRDDLNGGGRPPDSRGGALSPAAGFAAAAAAAALVLAGIPAPARADALPPIADMSQLEDVRVPPLVHSDWHQRGALFGVHKYPCYNYYTPECPCGCVATALAQILRSHEYPTNAVVPETFPCWYDNTETNMTMVGGVYDWSKMPLNPGQFAVKHGVTNMTEESEMIGRLCYDLGVACEAMYGTSGGTAAVPFSFPERAGLFHLSGVSGCSGSWPDYLQKAILCNLDAGLPVAMYVMGGGAAHEVVADGYGFSNNTAYVHVNWGDDYPETHDLWYALPNLVNDKYSYTEVVHVLYNIFPFPAEEGVAKNIVSGRTLGGNGVPLAGAAVVAEDAESGETAKTATSDARGIWSLILPSPGRYRVFIEGNPDAAREVELKENTVYDTNNPNQGEIGNVWGVELTDKNAAPQPPPPQPPQPPRLSALWWNGGEGGVWGENGAKIWLTEAGGETNWVDGVTAVFTNAEAVTAEIAAGGVTAAAVLFEGAAGVALEGGTLTMAGGARMVATNGADVFLNVPIAGADGLTVVQGRRIGFHSFLTAEDRLVFPGARLSEIGGFACTMGGGWINHCWPLPGTACQIREEGAGARSVQFQTFDGIVKGVKAVFTDSPDGVLGRTEWAKYQGGGEIGADLSGGTPGTVAASFDADGYGVAEVTALPTDTGAASGRFVIGRPAVFTGRLTLERGRIDFGPEGRLGAEGVFRGAVWNAGLIAAPPCGQIFAGPVSGTGRILVEGAAGAGHVRNAGFVSTGEEWTLVAEGRSLDDLTTVSGRTGGGWFNAPARESPYRMFYPSREEGGGFSCDLQAYDADRVKAVRVAFRQNGEDIEARVTDAKTRTGALPGDFPVSGGGWDNNAGLVPVDSDAGQGYGVRDVELFFGGCACAAFPGDTAAWTGGLTVGTNGFVDVLTLNACGDTGLPREGAVDAADGGEIRCYGSTDNEKYGAGRDNPVRLRRGGVLEFAKRQVFSRYDQSRKILLRDGGAVRPYDGDQDNVNYLNRLDVTDGGTVLPGKPFRIAYHQNARVDARGAGVCRQMAGYLFNGDDDLTRSLTLNVDKDAMLVIGGDISGYAQPTVKTGGGTAVYSGRNAAYNGATSVDGGTLRFETDSPLGPEAPVVLNGGTLDLGTCRNTGDGGEDGDGIGTLSVSSESTIRLGRGALAFADSSGANCVWGEDAALWIEGGIAGDRLRFGKSAEGLTGGRLGRIKLRGRPGTKVHLSKAGWLRGPSGLVFILSSASAVRPPVPPVPPEPAAPAGLYRVIDLSAGAGASSYPVTEMDAAPEGGWTDEYKTDKLVLRRIEPGTFTMGSPEGETGRKENETQHQVTLTEPYYIGVFEITQKQWRLVMGADATASGSTGDAHPVMHVSYNDVRGAETGAGWPASDAVDAAAFLGKIREKAGLDGFDLPTEAQWEYACRAGTATALNSGKDLTGEFECANLAEVGRYDKNRGDGKGVVNDNLGYAAVGSYLPNAWGLYDMHGNVWEWCLDWAGDYAAGPVDDPRGAESGTYRVRRGGSWNDFASSCRSAHRDVENPPTWACTVGGFRAACPASAAR